MASLQVKGTDDSLYDQLKRQSAVENRSVSQEILALITNNQKHLQRIPGLKLGNRASADQAGFTS